MKRFFKIFGITILAALFLGTMVFLFIKSRPEVQTYELLSPKTRTIMNSIIATGKVEPGNEVQIKPQISGIIDKIHFKPGDDVKVGDVISLKESSRKNEHFRDCFLGHPAFNLPYFEKNDEEFSGKLTRLPERNEIPIEVNDQYVVEYYSK